MIEDPQKTRIDWYLDHLKQDRHAIDSSVRYLAHDGYYQKKKFIDGVVSQGLHSIGNLNTVNVDLLLNLNQN